MQPDEDLKKTNPDEDAEDREGYEELKAEILDRLSSPDINPKLYRAILAFRALQAEFDIMELNKYKRILLERSLHELAWLIEGDKP